MDTTNNKPMALVCEDDGDLSTLYSFMLERLGFEVRVRVAAEECLSLVCEVRFDLILVDLNLPGMNGVGLIDEIRESRRNAQTRIVAVSARTSAEDAQTCLRHGADAFMGKPATPQRLVEVLTSLMRGERGKTVGITRERTEWRTLEQRRFFRQPIHAQARMRMGAHDRRGVAVTLVDISADGLRLTAQVPLRPDDVVLLHSPLFTGMRNDVAYRVVWVTQREDGTTVAGLQLGDRSDGTRRAMQQIVFRQQVLAKRGLTGEIENPGGGT